MTKTIRNERLRAAKALFEEVSHKATALICIIETLRAECVETVDRESILERLGDHAADVEVSARYAIEIITKNME